jgi:hypothetical protein
VDADAELPEPSPRPLGEVIVPKGREQVHIAGETGELDRGDPATPGGLLEAVCAVDDLAARREARDTNELHPLDMADDREAQLGAA